MKRFNLQLTWILRVHIKQQTRWTGRLAGWSVALLLERPQQEDCTCPGA